MSPRSRQVHSRPQIGPNTASSCSGDRPVDSEASAELAALVRAELGEDSDPQTITAVPGVPVAASGKPDKRALLRLRGVIG